MFFSRKTGGAGTSDGSSERVIPPSGVREVNQHVWRFDKPDGGPAGVSEEECEVDIVFFHGLQEKGRYEEAAWKSWSAKDNDSIIWPKDWLSKHLPKARIFSVSYNASASKIKGDYSSDDIIVITDNLVKDIITDTNIGRNCPVFLVGHCLGGILIKQFILTALKQKDEMNIDREQVKIQRVAKFLENLKGAFFYGVPCGGVRKETFDNFRKHLKTESRILTLLTTLDLQRSRINQQFRQQRNIHKVQTYGMAEALETTCSGFRGIVVPEASNKQDVDEYYTHFTADHFTVCKAGDVKDSTVLIKLVNFIAQETPEQRITVVDLAENDQQLL